MHKHLIVLIVGLVGLFASCTSKQKKEQYAAMPAELAEIYRKIDKNPHNADLYVELSRYYTNTRELDKALSNALIALRLSPDNSGICVAVSDVYFAMEYIDNAEEMLEKAIVLNNKNNDAYLKLGLLYLSRGDYKKTEEILTKAIQLQTHNPQAYHILGWNYRKKGDTALAIRNYLFATNQNPDYFDAYLELGYLHHCKLNPLTIDYYNNALNVQPDNIHVLYNMAMFYQKTGDYEKALEKYRMVLQLEAKNNDEFYFIRNAYHNMGWVYSEKEQKYEEAVVFYTKALQMDTTYIEAVYNRGFAFQRLKQYDNARQDYLYCLRLEHNYPLAVEGLNWLDKLQKR